MTRLASLHAASESVMCEAVREKDNLQLNPQDPGDARSKEHLLR